MLTSHYHFLLYHKEKNKDHIYGNKDLRNWNELLQMACEHLKASNNEVEVQAKHWAFELMSLSTNTRKKAVNDILYEGRLGTFH